MHPILIYLFPGLMDIVVSAAYFVSTVRAVELGLSPSKVAAVITANAAGYMVFCVLTGWVLTPRNAAALTVAGCLGTALVAVGFIVFPTVPAMYVLMVLLALTTALFFIPFQVFMKMVDQGKAKPITYSTGLYTFSWSTGFALGPFISGLIWQRLNWQGSYAFCAVAALVAGGGVVALRHHARAVHVPAAAPAAASSAPAPAPATDYAAMPDFAWMAWLCGGIGCLTVSLVRAMFPLSGSVWHLSKPEQGTIFFLISMTQALTGLALVRGRRWMYRPGPLVLFALTGVAGLLLFSAASSRGSFAAAAILYGLYSGSFYFYFVFHSLVHPVNSPRYLAINEAVVGVAGIAGPMLGGLLAERCGLSWAYVAAAACVVGAATVQTLIHRRPHGVRAAPP